MIGRHEISLDVYQEWIVLYFYMSGNFPHHGYLHPNEQPIYEISASEQGVTFVLQLGTQFVDIYP